MTPKTKTRKARSGEIRASRVRLRVFATRLNALQASRRSGSLAGRTVLALLFTLAAILSTAAVSASAENSGPPIFELNSETQLLTPDVSLVNRGATEVEASILYEPSDSEVHFEYATSKNGPWTVDSVPVLSRGHQSKILHLLPGTPYYIRAVAVNAYGESVSETGEFTTLPISVPYVSSAQLAEESGKAQEALGVTYADLEAEEVNREGAETAYQFEYAEHPTGPWSLVPGGGGSVTVAENFVKPEVKLTGLAAETTYYVRVKATNVKGTTTEFYPNTRNVGKEPYFEVTTRPAHPMVYSPSVSMTGAFAHVKGTVIADEAETGWRVEYASEPGGPWTVGFSGTILAAEAGVGFHNISGELSGLSPAKTYYVRLFAENEHGHVTSGTTSVETGGPPLVTTFATHVLDGETLRALGSVEPHGYDTHYYFQYVTQEQFAENGFAQASSTPEVDAGSGLDTGSGYPTTLVYANLPGLSSGVTYHYRLVASSSAPGDPVVLGGEQALTVPTPGPGEEPACPNAALRTGPSAALPDCRAYEQVTPVDKEGAQDIETYNNSFAGALVGEDGEHFWLWDPGVQWGASPDPSHSNYQFTRTATGWRMTSITPSSAGPDSYQPEIFNGNLTQVGLGVGWETTDASASANLEFQLGAVGGPYATLTSVPRKYTSELVAASADFSKQILRSEDHSLLGSASGTTTGYDLYEYSAGELRQVNVDGGSPIGSCGARMAEGYEDYDGSGGGSEGGTKASSPHAVSANGSRVFFEAVPGDNCGEPSDLYMRVNGSETVDIGAGSFLAANAEGTQVLLQHDNNGVYEVLLYETETGQTKLLTSLNRSIQTRLIVAEDMNVFYLSTPERLTGEAPPGGGIYRYDIGTETLSFVVQSNEATSSGNNSQSVSPDGRYLYWNSEAVTDVPGGANSATAPSVHTFAVYRYDSAENVVQCMSCASPYDPEPKLESTFQEQGTSHSYDGVPDATVSSANGDYVFFDTTAALVPQDVDGEVAPETSGFGSVHESFGYSTSSDVYEWRKNGVDGCSHIQGCLALISSGTGGEKNVLIGTTESGRDVFFATHSQLAPTDTDSAGDIYDARIGGGFPTSVRPVECEGDACSTPLAPPVDSTPASLSFSGPGNMMSVTVAIPKGKPKTKAKSACKAKAKNKCAGKPRKKAVRKAKKSNHRKGR